MCGPNVLATAMNYWGDQQEQEVLAEELAAGGAGTLNVDLVVFARRQGYRTDFGRRDIPWVRDRLRNCVFR
jgi:hypothetical protein